MTQAGGTSALSDQLERWTAAGFINQAQAAQIAAAEHTLAQARPGGLGAPRRRLPLVAEVLGYVGAVLAATAIGVALHQVWKHVPPAGWLAFTAVLAVGLLAAGAMVRIGGEPAFARLRSILWLLSTAGAAGFASVLAGKFLHLADNSVALSAEAAGLAFALPMWWRTRSAIQQTAAFAGAVALAETGLLRISPHVGSFGYGMALWVLAACWGVLAGRGYVAPRTTGLVLSGAGTLAGALIAMISDAGPGEVLGLVTVAGLLAAGIATHRVLLIGLGAAGSLYVIPDVASRYLPGSLGAPLAFAAVGLILLWLALRLARQRRDARDAAGDGARAAR
jgi:hypothetical protein